MPVIASPVSASTFRPFQPSLIDERDMQAIKRVMEQVPFDQPIERAGLLRSFASSMATNEEEPKRNLRIAVAASLLADLLEQGWGVGFGSVSAYICPPEERTGSEETLQGAKDRHRQSLLKASNRQIAGPGVQEFLRSMERSRTFEGRTVSIASLIDDGSELGAKLAEVAGLSEPAKPDALSRLIHPVLELCDSDGRCAKTGLKLLDIWRYFRHTWTLEYNPLPGRTLRFLVRNKARPNWPIMGIAMLASPAANLIVRDRWIGWRVDDLAEGIVQGRWDAKIVGKALLKAVEEAIEYIRTDDLLSPDELTRADRSAIFKLRTIVSKTESGRLNDLRTRGTEDASSEIVDIRDFGKPASITINQWKKLSETSLFIKKRAEQLIPILEALSFFRSAGFERHPAAAVMESLVSPKGRQAINVALNEIKKKALATEVADVSVCGAIAPYNELLGGKLVALMMTSHEARQKYSARYSGQISEIASQIAGTPVRRSAELKVLTTTSLYGIGSSQYNRLKLRAHDHRLKNDIAWTELEQTEGFTVTHVSKTTVEYMRHLGRIVYGTRRINSVFGEGSSPRTRQIREGLNLIGINNEHVLKHSLKRRVYACELFPGSRDALTGFAKAKPLKGDSVAKIGRAWLERWVVNRCSNPDVLARIKKATATELMLQMKQRAIQGALEIGKPVEVTEGTSAAA